MSKRASKFGRTEQVGDGLWRIWWKPLNRYKPDGSRNRPSATFRGSEEEADRELARLYLGEHGPDDGTTYEEFWEASVAPTLVELEAKTRNEYLRLWRRELSGRIGPLTISGTDHDLVQGVIDQIEAPTVQRSVLRLWKKILNMPGASKIVPRNPVDRHIKVRKRRKRVKHEVVAEEVVPYLRDLAGTRYQLMSALMMVGGLGLEETVPVCGTDVRERTYRGRRYALVRIDKAVVSVGGKILKETKNEIRERTQWFAEPFAGMILDSVHGDGPLFPSRTYRPGSRMDESWFLNPCTLSNNWRDWCERNDVGYVRFGDMRTIYSDRQAEADSPDSLVSAAMGHSDGTTRGRNYKRATDRGMAMIADNIAALLTEECPCLALFDDEFVL